MLPDISINAAGHAPALVQALADTGLPVKFTTGGSDLTIKGGQADLDYLINSLRDFGLPMWIKRELAMRAVIMVDEIVFIGLKLRLPLGNCA